MTRGKISMMLAGILTMASMNSAQYTINRKASPLSKGKAGRRITLGAKTKSLKQRSNRRKAKAKT